LATTTTTTSVSNEDSFRNVLLLDNCTVTYIEYENELWSIRSGTFDWC